MQLEKLQNLQSKVLFLLPKLIFVLIVLIIVKMDSSSIKVHTLLDYGASACFMDKYFVDRHKVPFVIKNILSP
jgi:hypothetical protein